MPDHGIQLADGPVLYRMRGQVELVFRTLKHRMNTTQFFCFHPNGVRLPIYVSLCAHVRVRVLMARRATLHRIPIHLLSFDKALTTVQCWMWERWEHLWTPRPGQRYLRELLDLLPIHRLLVTKKKPKAKNSAG